MGWEGDGGKGVEDLDALPGRLSRASWSVLKGLGFFLILQLAHSQCVEIEPLSWLL